MEEKFLQMDDSWDVLMSMFPANWRELAKETSALVRKLRNFKDEECVMRILLLHLANGYSLRETVTRAKISNLTDITDVALLKRLKSSEIWLKELCLCLLRERGVKVAAENNKIQMRLVDGTIVREPGKTGSQWRIHYSMKLPDLQCDYFKLTPADGQGNGETLTQFSINKNDCIVGDRGYSHARGIAHIEKNGAFSLVRVNTQTLEIYELSGERFPLLESIAKLEKEFQIGEWNIKVSNDSGGYVEGRLCVIRKSSAAAEKAIAHARKSAERKQRIIKPETLEYAKYIIVFTTLPIHEFPVDTVLEWYRLRWQIELVFKRLKSLTHIGHVPKYDDQSSRAWLYGKLFVALLVEKLICHANLISPWGYALPWQDQKSMA